MKPHIFQYTSLGLLGMLFLLATSCKKDWLDKKPNSKLAVLSTIEEYQTFMDNSLLYSATILPAIGGDHYYIPERNQGSLDAQDVSYYLWANKGYASSFSGDWITAYQAIFICNSTIEGLSKIDKTENPALWNEVYGSALFFRGYIYYQLAQVFCKQYDSATAKIDKGVPLRLETNVNLKPGRGTLQELYDHILRDLTQSVDYLPTTASTYKTRPSKIAAYAVLARYWLTIGNYEKTKNYAELALGINNTLIDLNALTPTAALGFATVAFDANPEVFFYTFAYQNVIAVTNAIVDSTLYNSYSIDDLRKSFYFRSRQPNEYSFKGTYRGKGGSASDLFTSPAVDELYLIRAEVNARLGNSNLAIDDLNSLLIKRYKTGTFTSLVAGTAEETLKLVLEEREKELLFRGVRWTDLRRLNKQPSLSTTLIRKYNGNTYTLVPNSNWYVWPIPTDEIQYSGIEQNPR